MRWKIGVHAANYKNDSLVVRWINNVGPHVDKIFLAYPTGSFGYNPATRSNPAFANTADRRLIEGSKFPEKVTVVVGDWENEEDQRNDLCAQAAAAGCDYLIVQDIDEFFRPEEMERNLRGICDAPDFQLYKCPWMIFWKDVHHVLEHRSVALDHGPDCRWFGRNTPFNFSTSFCINLRRGVGFRRARIATAAESAIKLLPGLCCHLAWVHSDAGLQTKISTWVHSAEVKSQWYKLKWQNWRPDSRWLSYNNPLAWNRAIPFPGKLPDEIADYDPGFQLAGSPSTLDRLQEAAYDASAAALFFARWVKHGRRASG